MKPVVVAALVGIIAASPAAAQSPAPQSAGAEPDAGIQLKPTPALATSPGAVTQRELPAFIEADVLISRPAQDTVAAGRAAFRRGDTIIQADRLEYVQTEDLAKAQGNVRIYRGGDVYRGPELQLHVERFEGFFLQPTYHFLRAGAGGQAERVNFLDEKRAVAIRATYTSCTPDDTGGYAWLLSTDEVTLDFEANEGVARGAVLRFQGVPILATPYLTFPLSDARKSGFLPPQINLDSVSGFELALPYYWNIAPNRDATFTPTSRSRRGLDLGTEFRYLEPGYTGQVRLNATPDDQLAQRERYALDVAHSATLAPQWGLNLRVIRVSDDAYWKDFPRGIQYPTQRQLPAEGALSWGQGDFSAFAKTQRWQTLQDPASPITPPYDQLPQLGLRYARSRDMGFDGSIEGNYTRFEHPTLLSGSRLYSQAQISYPVIAPGWFVTPKFMVHAAQYGADTPMTDGRTGASSVVPTFSLDSGLIFERDTRWFGRDYTQTLEPRLFYVYTPFRDQSSLPNFDSALLDFSFASIFTENAFAGHDRIADADQLTMGAISRLVDPVTGAEVLRLGAVQRLRFADQRVTLGTSPATERASDILLGASTSIVPKWTVDATVQYNQEIKRSVRSVVGARYAPGPYRVFSTSYRLARGLSEQLDVGWQWPLFARDDKPATPRAGAKECGGGWYTVGRLNYSMRDRRVTDSIFGFEYESGCWIGRIVAERLSTSPSQATTRLLFQLELVGFSRLGSNPLRTLKDNIPGYRLLRDQPEVPSRFTTYE